MSDSIAIISDVHGNRHALEAVRRAQRQAGITRTWCLGDMVGYGAHPTECLRACVHASERCLAGNLDLAASAMVGDKEADVAAGRAAGCATALRIAGDGDAWASIARALADRGS